MLPEMSSPPPGNAQVSPTTQAAVTALDLLHRDREFLPYVPEEEQRTYQRLHTLLHQHLLPLRKSNSLPYTLETIETLRLDYEDAVEELVAIRKEFKRLDRHLFQESSSVSVSSSLSFTSSHSSELSSGGEQQHQHQHHRHLQVSPNFHHVSFHSTILTPTDTLLGQLDRTFHALLEPLVSKMSPQLYPLYVQLNDIYAQLDECRHIGAYSVQLDILPLQEKLVALENECVKDGKWLPAPAQARLGGLLADIPEGQAILFAKLHDCHRIAHFLVAQLDAVGDSLMPVYERLVQVHKQLSKMTSPSAFSTRQITAIQMELRQIDLLRHSHHDLSPGPGAFLDLNSSISRGQATVIHLLELCFQMTHALLSQKDPISGSLRPIYEKLIEYRRTLEELYESRHVWFVRGDFLSVETEIQEMQSKLVAMEADRVDGKFVIQNAAVTHTRQNNGNHHVSTEAEVSRGQAVLHFLLHKCHRTIYKIFFFIAANHPLTTTWSSESVQSVQADESSNEGGEKDEKDLEGDSTRIQHISTVPMLHPSLRPLHSHLQAIRRCLLQLHQHAPWSPSELLRWKLILKRIDDQRVNGRYVGSGGSSSSSSSSGGGGGGGGGTSLLDMGFSSMKPHSRLAILERMKFWKKMASKSIPEESAEEVAAVTKRDSKDSVENVMKSVGLQSQRETVETTEPPGSHEKTTQPQPQPNAEKSIQEGQALLRALWHECFELVLEMESQEEEQEQLQQQRSTQLQEEGDTKRRASPKRDDRNRKEVKEQEEDEECEEEDGQDPDSGETQLRSYLPLPIASFRPETMP